MTTTQSEKSTSGGEVFAERLDEKLSRSIDLAKSSATFASIVNPDSSPDFVRWVLRNVLLEVFSYAPVVVEASYAAIGRLPKTSADVIRALTKFILEEIDHSELALRDYVAQGGSEACARGRRPSPESFTLASTCRALASEEDPICCLGFLYYLEAMGSRLAPIAHHALQRLNLDAQNDFISEPADVDDMHSRILRSLIVRTVDADASRNEPIEFGFDCMSAVYPLPVWAAAFERASRESHPG